LTETKAPDGYNTIDPIDFNISYDLSSTGTSVIFKSSWTAMQDPDNDNVIEFSVINYPGSAMPHTGGIGTTIFYVVGTVMILCAGVLLITKKRMAREQH
jgi:LPXTG-motif cell wall-anchored protein